MKNQVTFLFCFNILLAYLYLCHKSHKITFIFSCKHTVTMKSSNATIIYLLGEIKSHSKVFLGKSHSFQVSVYVTFSVL